MRKREEFAVGLRKQKKDKIIRDRRKRMMMTLAPAQHQEEIVEEKTFEDNLPAIARIYRGCPLFIEESTHGAGSVGDAVSLKDFLNRLIPDYPADMDETDEAKCCENKVKQATLLLDSLFSDSSNE